LFLFQGGGKRASHGKGDRDGITNILTRVYCEFTRLWFAQDHVILLKVKSASACAVVDFQVFRLRETWAEAEETNGETGQERTRSTGRKKQGSRLTLILYSLTSQDRMFDCVRNSLDFDAVPQERFRKRVPLLPLLRPWHGCLMAPTK